jgi:hypothetical protein
MVDLGKIRSSGISSFSPSSFIGQSRLSDVGSIMSTIGETVKTYGEEIDEIQKEKDNLSILKAQNEISFLRNKFDQDVRNSGDYSNLNKRWQQQFDRVKNKYAKDVSLQNKDIFNVALDKQNYNAILQNAKIESDLRAKDISKEAFLSIDSLIDNTLPTDISIKNSTPEIISYINTIPGLTKGERKKVINDELHRLYMTTAQLSMNEDPKMFIDKNINIFKKYLNKTDINNLRLKARGLYNRKLLDDRRDIETEKKELLSKIEDMTYSISETGVPLDIDIVGRLRKLGYETDAKDTQAKIDNAYRVYNNVSKLEWVPFEERFEALGRLKPEPGARYYKSQQQIYDATNKALQTQIDRYSKDPAQYVTPEAIRISAKSGGNLYSSRILLESSLGTPPSQIQIYTNNELSRFSSDYKNALPESKSLLINTMIEDVPYQYRTQAVNQLPISHLDKFAYLGSEGVEYRRNIMLSASSFDQKTLSKADRDEIQKQIYEYQKQPDTPLAFYNDIANATGDVTLRITAEAAKGLVAKTAFYLTDKRIEDPLENANNIVFGADSSFVSNNVVIGKNSPAFNINDDVQTILEQQRENFIGVAPPGYSETEWLGYREGVGAVWVLRGDSFILYDRNKQAYIPSKNMTPITIPITKIINYINDLYDKKEKASPIIGEPYAGFPSPLDLTEY